jgi:putative DNA primase/helicase
MTGYRVTARLRRDHPELDKNGKPTKDKYVTPKGDGRHLYVPPGAKERLDDPQTIIVLVESEKAALALMAWAKRNDMKLLALATGGCWGWHTSRAKSRLAPNGERVDVPGPCDDVKFCNGHLVIVMLDSNARIEIKPDVYWAKSALLVEINKPERGCDLLLCDLPVENGVNGPDDYIAAHGDQAMAELLAQAHKPAYKSAQQQAEAESARAATEHSDDALALKFTEKYKDDLRYTATWGRWSMWNGRVWKPDTTVHVFDRVRAVCRTESAIVKPDSLTLARKIASNATTAAVEHMARSDRRHAATMEQWDADPWLLNTPDGIVDLRTGAICAARREDYLTKLTAAGPGGSCPLWQKFLERITANNSELMAFMQRVCGYALTGNSSEHAFFFCYGIGGNGKGTFVNTFAGLMGDYAKAAPIEILIDSRNERHPTELAGLQGARLVTAVETEEGRRWSESRLKMLTGGDPVSARYMRQDFFEYTPQFKLIVSGNHKPGLRAVDEAIRRRFRLLPFTVTIPEADRDKELGDKLRKEWPGILAWAIQGCLAWQKKGLCAPDAVRNATEDYLFAEDAIGQWFGDRCVQSTTWEFTTVLYQDWQAWAVARGEYPYSEKWFAGKLQDRGFTSKRTNAARGFQGIALRETGGVTDVTDPLYIDALARAHTHTLRPISTDLSHPSLEPNSQGERQPDPAPESDPARGGKRKLKL